MSDPADSNSTNGTAAPPDNLPRLADGTVDIDQLKIRLLIICKSKRQFESVANYLIRRGWETTITISIKDAFKTIAVFKPDFVLVSINLPTPKIYQLPGVIAQTFKVPSITFAESGDAKSLKMMHDIQATHRIMGSVSGPSAHRRIKQILQEIYHPKSATKKESADSKSKESDSIVVKGASSKESESQGHESGQFYSGENSINLNGSGSDGPGVFIAKGQESHLPNQYHDKGKSVDGDNVSADFSDDLAALAEQFQESNDERQTGFTAGHDGVNPGRDISQAEQENRSREMALAREQAFGANDGPEYQPDSLKESEFANRESRPTKETGRTQNAGEKNSSDSRAEMENRRDDHKNNHEGDDHIGASGTIAESLARDHANRDQKGATQNGSNAENSAKSANQRNNDQNGEARQHATAEQTGFAKQSSENQDPQTDLAAQGAGVTHNRESAKNESAEQSVAVADGEPVRLTKKKEGYAIVELFDLIVKAAKESALPPKPSQGEAAAVNDRFVESTIVPIESQAHKGYLVVAHKGSVEEEAQFMSAFLDAIRAKLPREFESIRIHDEQKIESADLQLDESLEGEINHFHSQNGAGQFVIKFLREAIYSGKIKELDRDNKAEIDPNDLFVDAPVGVQVYLHFPKNDRYYLYLKPRSRISERQKSRLIDSNNKLYINKSDTQTYQENLRQNKTLEVLFKPRHTKRVA